MLPFSLDSNAEPIDPSLAEVFDGFRQEDPNGSRMAHVFGRHVLRPGLVLEDIDADWPAASIQIDEHLLPLIARYISGRDLSLATGDGEAAGFRSSGKVAQ